MRLTLISGQSQVEPQTPLLYLDGSFEIPKVLPGTYLIADIARDTDTWVTVGNADVKDVVIGLLGTGDPLQKGATANGAISSVRVSGRISGRARTSAGASVRMTGTNLEEPLRASIFLDGSFEFLNVPAGTYSAEVHPPIAGAVAMNVSVGTADVTNLVLSVPDTKDLAGRVLSQAEAPCCGTCGSLSDPATLPLLRSRPTERFR